MIEFLDVTKIYQKDIIALDRINLRIDDGEFVFLIGPSGAGKSTLTKLILREEDVTEGEIYFNDTEISALGARRIPNLRRHFGVVFQDFRLLEDRDVFSNVAYALEIHGVPRKEIQNRVVDSLTRVGLLDKRKQFPHQLSGGEQQRISIARALINNPDVLIADEPTGNLDAATAEEVMKLLEEINETGTTIIMATHAKEIVNRMKRRVLELERGRLVRDEEHGEYEGEQNIFYEEYEEEEFEIESEPTDKPVAEETDSVEASHRMDDGASDTKEIPVIREPQEKEVLKEHKTHEPVAVAEETPEAPEEEENVEPLEASAVPVEEVPAETPAEPVEHVEEVTVEIPAESAEEIIPEPKEEPHTEPSDLEKLEDISQAEGPETEEVSEEPEEKLEGPEESEASEEELSPYELGRRYMEQLGKDEYLMTGALPGEEDDHGRN